MDVAIGKHRFKGGANRPSTNQAGPTRLHAHDVFFVCPARHQLIDVGVAQGFVKSIFNIVGTATQRGSAKFGLSHGTPF